MSRKPVLSGIMWWLTYMMMSSIFKPYFDDKNSLAAVVRDAKMIPHSIGRKTLVGYFNYIDKNKNLINQLTKTKVPVYYVRGEKDDIKFTDKDKAALNSSDCIKIVEIKDARHFAMIDKPDEIAKIIVDALD